jgi:hypothetical protein
VFSKKKLSHPGSFGVVYGSALLVARNYFDRIAIAFIVLISANP